MTEGIVELIGLAEEDRKFLKDLDSKCYTLRHDTSVSPPMWWGDYHDVKVTTEEIEKVLGVVESNESLIFMPIQGSFGFHPAFAVVGVLSVPGVNETEYLVHIDSAQLPEGYNFTTLKKHFANRDNVRKARFADITFDLGEGRYLY